MVAVRLLARPTRSPRPRPLPLLLRPLGSRPSSAGASPTADPIGHCRTLTRTHDPDAFLASYFYPAGRPREAFWAYRALNVSRSQLPAAGGGEERGRRQSRAAHVTLRAMAPGRAQANREQQQKQRWTDPPPLLTSSGWQLELATIAEGATNAQLGSIKLRWWKDVVRDISAVRPPSSAAAFLQPQPLPLWPRLADTDPRWPPSPQGKAPPAHPIAQALSLTATEQTADLTAYYWAQLIEARVSRRPPFPLPPPSLAALFLSTFGPSLRREER